MISFKKREILYRPHEPIIKAIVDIVVIVCAAFLMINFFFDNTSITGHSMNNTLKNDDVMLVNKVAFKYRDPKRYDVIIVNNDAISSEKEAFYSRFEEYLSEDDLNAIPGIGPVIAKAYVDYFSNEKHVTALQTLLNELVIPEEVENTEAQIFENLTFVITGSVEHFTNRNEVKAVIESKGGKVTGSVTAKTHYLINNDVNSTSSKNKKAKELGIPIITEAEFLEMLNE